MTPVEPGGVDNRTFRLGGDMTVRLPSAAGYRSQAEKEHRWLPFLAQRVALPIPVPLALGAPAEGYPFAWSIYEWLDGETACAGSVADLTSLATTLADFLVTLERVDPTDGPPAGPQSFYRGGPLLTYDDETRRAIEALVGVIPTGLAYDVWERALDATWHGRPVWFHGDVACGNLLVRDGRLAAVIDFGCSGVGDPACDLVIAWTLLSGESREAFRTRRSVDTATWARGRGWALWKALITIAWNSGTDPAAAAEARLVLEHVLADHLRSG